MNIEISTHAKKRAKQRFRLKYEALKRMVAKAVVCGEKKSSDNYDSINYVYAHFNFIFKEELNKLVLLTVTNLTGHAQHKEGLMQDVRVGGSKNARRMIMRQL